MKKLPTIICTSTIRSAQEGESHGGIYLVDLESESVNQVIDWNDNSIVWEGRGSDRGLRGVAFYKEFILCAASGEFLVYDQEFNIVKSFKNQYLKHCHEIFVQGDYLYLTSTGYDSILEFDLIKEEYTRGFLYRTFYSDNKILNSVQRKSGISKKEFRRFDPNKDNGPEMLDSNHINNVFAKDGSIYFSGTGLKNLFRINQEEKLEKVIEIPKGTHNVMYHNDYLIFNNTANNTLDVRTLEGKVIVQFNILQYPKENLLNSDIPNDHARQGFGRGLFCEDDFIIGGSSPATISVFSIDNQELIKTVNLTMDIKNAIHGLEVFPFSFLENKYQKVLSTKA